MNAAEKNGRRIVKERSGGYCEVRIRGICTGRAESVHHRKNRSQGGSWAPSNLLHLCGDGVRGCHGWITEHPALSYDNGWAVRGCNVPAEEPVFVARGLVLLDDTGNYKWQKEG
ncbi:HNH endonuclease [Rhodococcus sp. JT-3]|uniref:HNH endonuclease n=1 Tax=Rhodococcus sp. JT-3 TaxID=1973213 RepID=UPI001303E2F9|nr:HNH endonuclease [Rhodococcus sp. JT-3]